jgi:steroid 5-alpha reductase family enzyme
MPRDVNPEDFWVPIVTVFGLQISLFIVAWIIKDNSIVDIFWSIGIALPNLVVLIVNGNWHHRTIISLILVWLWALRLSIHIGVRHSGEDWRYANWREQWRNAGGCLLEFVASLNVVFMLQGLFMVVVGSSVFFTAIYSDGDDDLFVLEFIGAFVFLFGLIFEAIGDWQLSRFIKNPENKGHVIQSGLWSITRHPNYFGEAVVWWGAYIYACSIMWGFVTIWSAITITLLLRFVSGVPMLEKKYEDRKEFQEYKKRVNIFVPWFPKSKKSVGQVDHSNPIMDDDEKNSKQQNSS